jgi:hypothetical protein
MEKKWLLVSDQEVTELKIDLGNEQREAVDLRGYFSSSDHGLSYYHSWLLRFAVRSVSQGRT